MTAPAETLDPSAPLDADALAAIEAMLDHVNDNHADTVLLVARHLAPEAADAEIARVDRRATFFAVRTTERADVEVRLDFPAPISEVHEVQQHLLAAVADARAAADPGTQLTSLERELQVTAALTTVHGRVGAVRRLTTNLLELTLTGFAGYPLRGGDEFVYVMVSDAPDGISPTYGMEDYRQQADDPVRGAYYTVRRWRPEAGEIDLWVVEHDHAGSVAAWMASAGPGDPIALWGPRQGFGVPDGARHVLLVADETGIAAVAALLDVIPSDRRVTAVLECVDAGHRPPLPTHPGLDVVWVDRGDDPPGITNRLLATVTSAITDPPDAAFGAGESRQISAVRRHARQTLGLPAASVLMTGYWRRQDA
jgi:NADPH-dependent ferric siderophore reductase